MRKLLTIVCAAAAAAGIAAYFCRDTFSMVRDQMTRTAKSEKKMNDAEAERAKLLTEKARMSSPAGREEAARQLGYKRPGELPVRKDR